jgi:UTP--glucose-1-phosphate uridylyltransferase
VVEKPKKAVIPAAGMGKRFYPLTRAQPKEMLPIVDKPVIHYIVDEAVKSGLNEILIIVGYGKDAIVNYFDKSTLDDEMSATSQLDFPDIYFVRQKKQLGLGDALRYARGFADDEPFAVLLGDTIYTSPNEKTVTTQILDKYSKLGEPVIAVEKVPKEKISDYGIVSGKRIDSTTWKVKTLVEKPSPETAPSKLGITGTYILDGRIFEYLDQIKPGRNGEYQLTDALSSYVRDYPIFASSFLGKRYDIGTKELWIKTFLDFAGKDPRFSSILHKRSGK